MLRYFLLLALVASASCSPKIYLKGKYADVLKSGTSRTQVVATLGPPAQSQLVAPTDFLPPAASVKRKKVWEDTYIVRDVIPDAEKAATAGFQAGMSLGIKDLIMVPCALSHLVPRKKSVLIRYDRKD